MNRKIALFDVHPYDRDSFSENNRAFGFEITYFEHKLNPQTVSLTRGLDAVCLFVNDRVTPEIADALYENGVRLVALRAAGYNNIDLEAVYEKIHVVRVPSYSPHAVAEHAAALILCLNRKIHKAYYRTRDNNFNINGLLGFDLHGKTAGVIGTGQIGKIMIRILRGFGMRVLAYDLYPDEAFSRETGCQYAALPRLYAESDVISLHCPLTAETRHLVNAESLSRMKRGVMLINTGRGHLIDTQALIDALKNGKVGAAGLDVYEEESEYFFEDFSSTLITDDVLARLLSFHNVLITSHQGFFTREALRNIACTTLENIRDFFENKPLRNEICYRCKKDFCRKAEKGACF